MGLVAFQGAVWGEGCWGELVRERSRLSEVLPLEGEHALVVVVLEHIGTGCLSLGLAVVVVDNIHSRDHELHSTLRSWRG